MAPFSTPRRSSVDVEKSLQTSSTSDLKGEREIEQHSKMSSPRVSIPPEVSPPRVKKSRTNSSSRTRTRPFRTSTNSVAIREAEVDIVAAVFGLGVHVIRDYPGVKAYCHFIENELSQAWYRNEAIEPAFKILGYSIPMELPDFLRFFIRVANVLRTNDKKGISLSELFELVLDDHVVDIDAIDGEDLFIPRHVKQIGQHLVFSIIGWTTMLFKPVHSYNSAAYSLQADPRWVRVTPSQPALADISDRPIAKLLRNFGDLLPVGGANLNATVQWETVVQQNTLADPPRRISGDVQIQTSLLNYYSLVVMAHVNIEWTDSLSAHLNFHPASRTLFLFKFPTFCALSCMRRGEEGNAGQSCFDRVLREYYDDQSTVQLPLILEAYKREVILSYRLIFGQRKKSRELYKRPQANITNSSSPEKNTDVTGSHDDMLDLLCKSSRSMLSCLPSEMWPESCRDTKGNLLEQETYSMELDFAFFGAKLLLIQEFCRRQSPSRMRDLWRDRRNPLQWYTFWAVIIVGGLSIVLQIIQIGLAAAQLAYTPKP